MKSVFERLADVDFESLKDKHLSDYEPYQLAAHMLKHYPGDPIGALKSSRSNYEIGTVLYEQTYDLLEGYLGAKRN